ncbi:hypothetical protein FSP39_001137 [Pinctada imbricata]|uniref:Uncharacterized protein n=1 Tax=Pinctada imbricata TaxID=66713 RepID=A0AA88XTU3_PINIB|nr:hypothetical protein FSP39_001137 [Pinctada imbricata]
MAVAFLSPSNIGHDITPQDPMDRLQVYKSDKEYRQRTFGRFPVTLANLREQLTEDGFLYIGDGHSDKVQCAHCGGVLSGWTTDDDVRQCHKKFYPNCPFVKRENIEKLILENVKHPEYSSLDKRMTTFDTWPHDQMLPVPDKIAKAGLFYTGQSDICQCYACGNQLYEWDEDDDPKVEHDDCFPDCILSNNNDLCHYKMNHSQI